MLGLVIALLVCGWNVFLSGHPIESGFLAGVHFLWWWYLVWTIFQGVFMILVLLGITIGGTAAGALLKGKRMGILGFMGGGALSTLILAIFAVQKVALLGSTYLLGTAGDEGMTFAQFDQIRLIFGSILLIGGILMGRSHGGSSNSSKGVEVEGFSDF
jgi:hypothetical protein